MSPHPFVTIFFSRKTKRWLACYTVPKTGKLKTLRLRDLGARTAAQRTAWAVEKSKALVRGWHRYRKDHLKRYRRLNARRR